MAKLLPFRRRTGEMERTSDQTALDTRRINPAETTELADESIYFEESVESIFGEERRPSIRETGPISIEALYPGGDEYSSRIFSNAIKNLENAIGYIDEALDAEKQARYVAADDAMLHFEGLLPHLFCCRSLGDGFGIIINSITIAIQNRRGEPLERNQIKKIRHSIELLKREPFLSIENAIIEVTRLEETGLNPDLPELDFVADNAE